MLHSVKEQTTPNSTTYAVNYTPLARDQTQTPYLMSDLSTGCQLVLWSVRKWLQIRRFPGKFDSQLLDAHTRIRAPQAANSIEECMELLACSGLRTIIIECPCKAHLSCDEFTLLHTFRALQSGHDGVAAHNIARLIRGRLGDVFCRSARDYAHSLERANLDLSSITKLTVAK